MDNFQLNFDSTQAKILMMLLNVGSTTPAERRELIPLKQHLEEQLGEG